MRILIELYHLSTNKMVFNKAFHIFFTISIIFCFAPFTTKSQTNNTDSIPIDKVIHSPKKATIFSTVIPGLGQAYNKKYWKIPVIYAGIGACTYFFISNNSEYKILKNELQYRFLQDTLSLNPKYTTYSDQNLIALKNYYQRNRELSIIFGVIIYALNIIDASVDAHLFSFDVSDDLTLNIQPYTNVGLVNKPYRTTNGLALILKF